MGPSVRRRILHALVVLSALAFAAPTPALAGDCATDYVVCLNDYGDFVTSISYHEKQCWGDYVDCLRRLILVL